MLGANGFPDGVMQSAKQQRLDKPERSRSQEARNRSETILRLPFVNDRLAEKLRQTVRAYNREVRLVFTSGKSLKDMLVCSSFVPQVGPKTMYQRKEKKGKGRPPECRACDAGIVDGHCLSENVVYSMFCSVCKSENVGETERCLRDWFREHWQQAWASTPNTPWGAHFAAHHGAQPRPSSIQTPQSSPPDPAMSTGASWRHF